MERLHPHQARSTRELADRASARTQKDGKGKGQLKLSQLPQSAQGHGWGHNGDHGIRGREAAKDHVDKLLKSLNKLEKARWSHNPHDERGQGNNGKVNMRDPYGHDKDSGREKSERGRPIREVETDPLNLEELLMVDFQIVDVYLAYLQRILDYYSQERFSQYSWYSWYVNYLQDRITNYTSRYSYDRIRVNMTDTIDYTLTLGTQEGYEGTTLLVTTSLISINDYDAVTSRWSYNSTTGRWEYTVTPIQYDAGEVVVEQTQEVTIGEDDAVTFSYDPPSDLASYSGNYFELAVTVTEPESGQTYTTTYDRSLYLYRCPYGIIYDTKTGQPIVGATVTVHNADGSIVALDRASNPNVSNPQTTDATGRYNAKLAIGKKYYLTVKAPGYEEYRSTLFSERWHIVREDVSLTPSTLLSKK